MWTPTTRAEHNRDHLRYETDLTDAEWAILEPLLAKPKAVERPPEWPLREIVNAIFHMLRGGIGWRLIPSDMPTRSTVFDHFSRRRDKSVFASINHRLVMADRERLGRGASPSAAVIDNQSDKTTESGGPKGYDAGKKVAGRKRQAMVNTDGRALVIEPQPADIQDRDGTVPVLKISRKSYWVVGLFFGWISRKRRLWKDPEPTIASETAFLYAASVIILNRRASEEHYDLSGRTLKRNRDEARSPLIQTAICAKCFDDGHSLEKSGGATSILN